MFSFLETICVENGKAKHLGFHQLRIENVFADFYPSDKILNIHTLFSELELPNSGKYRVRVVFEQTLIKTEIIPYKEKLIQKLKIVEFNELDYSYKWADRSYFSEILKQNSMVDEVIITQNGVVKDCTIANLAFYKEGKWYTPRIPLLKGTTRARLIEEGKIQEVDIFMDQIHSYSHICLINVFRELSLEKSLLVSNSIL
jgi:4-amino-4-deoxychorismate lyase